MILKDALTLVLVGTVVGIPVALGLTKYVSSLLYGITPRDPLSTTAAVAALVGIAVFASYLPARRASRVDPNIVLRYEVKHHSYRNAVVGSTRVARSTGNSAASAQTMNRQIRGAATLQTSVPFT